MSALISKLGLEYIREFHGLVYGLETFSNSVDGENLYRGFSFYSTKENLSKVLEEIFNMLYGKVWKDYLFSEQGRSWFESRVSAYIFPQNQNIDDSYAEDIAGDVLFDWFFKYDYDYAKEVVKKLKVEDLSEFMEDFLKKTPPGVWMVSPYKSKEIEDIFRESTLYKAKVEA